MSPIVMIFLKTAALPAVLSTVLLFFTGQIAVPMKQKVQALVLALCFALGNYLLLSRLSVPPSDVGEAFTFVALILAVFVWIAPVPMGSRYLLRTVFVVACGALLLWPIRESLNGQIHLRNMLAFFFLALGVWSILEKMTSQVKATTLIVMPLLAMTALSLLMLFNGSASFSNSVTSVCALFGGALVLALIFPSRLAVEALIPFLSVFAILFMAAGHFYLDVNPWKMIIVCIPYFVLWIRGWMPFIPKHPIVEPVALGILAAVPLAYFVYGWFQAAGNLM